MLTSLLCAVKNSKVQDENNHQKYTPYMESKEKVPFLLVLSTVRFLHHSDYLLHIEDEKGMKQHTKERITTKGGRFSCHGG